MINSYAHKLYTGLQNLWRTRRRCARVIHILRSNLTEALASTLAGEPLQRIARRRCLVLVGVLCIAAATPTAHAIDHDEVIKIEMYKLYTHMKIGNDKQYRCVVTLWRLESHWNSKARNAKSSARGIPQLLKLTETNPYKQIDLGMKYVDRRYKGDYCKALAYHKKHGHY
jgi:hypothetical protein